MSLRQSLERQKSFQDLLPFLPSDHSKQSSADALIGTKLARTLPAKVLGLDLGCGSGVDIRHFEALNGNVEWFGVDIQDSNEVRDRRDTNRRLVPYDGVKLPFRAESFDLIFSKQVLEHVRHPDALLSETCRVLRPGGSFVGSVAYLEPYHSHSIFNFTPYGVIRTFQDAGLDVLELRPGADGLSLIVRQALNKRLLPNFLIKHSMGNYFIDFMKFVFRLSNQNTNFLKLQFSGHICFLASKDSR